MVSVVLVAHVEFVGASGGGCMWFYVLQQMRFLESVVAVYVAVLGPCCVELT